MGLGQIFPIVSNPHDPNSIKFPSTKYVNQISLQGTYLNSFLLILQPNMKEKQANGAWQSLFHNKILKNRN